MENENRVSIILTTLNNKDDFKKCIDSVLLQDYPYLEIIIKDGGSTDGTVQLAEQYVARQDKSIRLISSADSGIYDAMNQGYNASTGEMILFFNDRFAKKDAIAKLVSAINKINPETKELYKGVHADLVYIKDSRKIRTWVMGRGNIITGWLPAHPTLLLRREVYEKYGLYRQEYHISADYEFMIRFLKREPKCLNYIHEILVIMEYGGASNSSYYNNILEAHKALRNNKVVCAWGVILLRTIRVSFQFFKAKIGI